MTERAAEVDKASTHNRRGVFETLAQRTDQLRRRWQSSLSLRTIAIILIGGIAAIAIMATAIVSQIKDAVFEQTVQTNIEQFATDAAVAQESFGISTAPTVGQSQLVAVQIVSGMYDPSSGLIGAVLIRSPDQAPNVSQILEPATASATRVRSLVTNELRETTRNDGDIAWQSVAVPNNDGGSNPGVVIGTTIRIPGSGMYELYAAYTLESQEQLLGATFRALALSVVGLLVLLGLISWIVMRLVLRPIREASLNAQHLADGEFHSRMEVRGSDELAQLGESFNQMAASLEDQFTRMQRMSKVQTDFVSAVSHELRSPVTTIRMAGQLIYDKREELPPALKRSAELQHSQLINLDTMLSDLLEISRYDAGGMSLATEEEEIAQIVKDVIKFAEPLAVDNGVVVTFEEIGDTIAHVEPRRVERIVRNLVVNALEHADGKPVHVTVTGGRDAVAISVQDRGIGLSEEQAEHVFDRFWRADSSRVRKSGGTGLGLTIAREDAQIHGGTLEAIGELGVGSTFLATLPREPGQSFSRPLSLEVLRPVEIPETESPPVVVDSDPDLDLHAAPQLQVDSGAATGSTPATNMEGAR